MGMFDRAAESGTGRWHVCLKHPAGIVTFADYTSDSMEDAVALAASANPGWNVEWAVREPNRFGVFSPGGPCE